MAEAIRLEGAERWYRGQGEAVAALDGVDLVVNQGDFIAIMGRSGSGKSTLLNIIGCLDRLDRGSLFVDGIDTAGLRDDQRSRLRGQKVGFVFQSFHLIPSLSVLENVLFPVRYDSSPRPEARSDALDLLESVGLRDLHARRPNQLSGGQKQRVALARALINKPPLLLADEPTGNLDSATSGDVLDLFESLNRAGQTIVLVTHDDDVAKRCSKTIHMRDGKIV